MKYELKKHLYTQVSHCALQELPYLSYAMSKKTQRPEEEEDDEEDDLSDPEALDDNLFTHLQDTSQLFATYDTDVNIKIAAEIKIHSLLSGDVIWTRGKPFSKVETAHYTKVFTVWLQQMIRSCLTIGFAIATWTTNEQFGADPCILVMDQVDVYYYKHYTGRTFYRVYEKPSNSLFSKGATRKRNSGGPISSTHIYGRRLHRIHVIEWAAPATNGSFNSRLVDLRNDIEFETRLLSYAGTAYELAAAPHYVTEAVQQAHDEAGMSSALSTRIPDRGHKMSEQEQMINNARLEEEEYYQARMANSRLGTMIAEDPRHQQQENIESRLHRTNQLYLGEGRKYVKQNLPAAPQDMMLLLERYKHRVLELFGIPASMMSTDAAKGGSENVARVFFDSSRQFTRQCQANVEEFMNIILLEKHLGDYIKANPKKEIKEEEVEGILKDMTVHCNLTGSPDDLTVDKLYLLGAMTYEQLCICYGGRYGIPRDGFHLTAKLDLEKANGIKEAEPAKPAKKKKKK